MRRAEGGAKLASVVILVKGVLNTLLGALHIVGAFTFEARKVAGQGTPAMRRDYILWFGVVGAFILFMGLLDVFCYQGLKARRSWAWRISLLCAAFTTLTGVSGVMAFGVSPPLELLATGIAGLAVLSCSRGEFRDGSS